jgi:hypothetical protein
LHAPDDLLNLIGLNQQPDHTLGPDTHGRLRFHLLNLNMPGIMELVKSGEKLLST